MIAPLPLPRALLHRQRFEGDVERRTTVKTRVSMPFMGRRLIVTPTDYEAPRWGGTNPIKLNQLACKTGVKARRARAKLKEIHRRNEAAMRYALRGVVVYEITVNRAGNVADPDLGMSAGFFTPSSYAPPIALPVAGVAQEVSVTLGLHHEADRETTEVHVLILGEVE